ncbi:DUF6677 family protein [Paenibacillus radicis (ex Xue et al. 2023)]|uniref:TM2 domain-containing protein n=1 Tax=Paenibacillus radicis (ex Xue et al. 2023) TaxID=2972489 RepID=A0ABT1Y9V6_9BACL|nr:DUF6677 family protein [Paenibacillus radicis (ex Xue et al. 2023)]MCR8629974.1 hypothetical protein [Paenibacillus radicis (ex Xue et al. 2023)]
MDEHLTNNPHSNIRHEEQDTDPFMEERFKQMNPPLTPPPFIPYAHKSKLMAGLLAFFIPGTGHLYLGLMQKGLLVMMLLVLDICMIITFDGDKNGGNPVQTFFCLMFPVIYFYSLFDVMHSTEKVNARNAFLYNGHLDFEHMNQWFDEPLGLTFNPKKFGLLLIAGGMLVFVFSTKPQWIAKLFEFMGSYLGAIVLIAIGIFLFLGKSKKQ